MLSGLFCHAQSPNLHNGLVAYYPFNGNANDESGNGNHGTIYGASPTTDRFNISGKAFIFNGIDNFIKANSSGLPSSERTMSLWLNANSVTGNPTSIAYGGSWCGDSWFQVLSANILSWLTDSHCDANPFFHPFSIAPTNQWYHWVITNDASGRKMYVNGVLVSSNPVFVSNTYVLEKDLAIGVCVSGSGHAPFANVDVGWFNGKLDDIRIYDRALSTAEIDLLYRHKHYSIYLNAGWNLISFDVVLPAGAPYTVFSQLISGNNLLMVTGFQNQQGVYFDPNGLPFLNTLDSIIPGEGYWVKVQNPDTLIVEGFRFPNDFTINLKTGWNLIAYWPQNTTSPELAFSTLISAGVLQMVTGYEQGGKYFDPNGPPFLNTLTEIKNGFGYWVKVSEDYYSFSYPLPAWQCGDQITDERDGKIYATTQIGNHCWMKQNLNVGTRIDGGLDQTNNGVIEKYCYDNNEFNCETRGGFYQWSEIMDYSLTESSQGICPSGWHIPSENEWCEMASGLDSAYYCGWGWDGYDIGNELKKNGTSNFNAIYTGSWHNGFFWSFNNGIYYWSSSYSSDLGVFFHMNSDYTTASRLYKDAFLKSFGFSVRCLKD